jgi:hypothetical protein
MSGDGDKGGRKKRPTSRLMALDGAGQTGAVPPTAKRLTLKQDEWMRGWRHGAAGGVRQVLQFGGSGPALPEYNEGYDSGVESRKAAKQRADRLYPVDLTERILSQ